MGLFLLVGIVGLLYINVGLFFIVYIFLRKVIKKEKGGNGIWFVFLWVDVLVIYFFWRL